MFNETSYFNDALNPGGTPLWESLGFGSKAAWKQAGRPTDSTFTPPSGLPRLPGSGGTLPGATGGATDQVTGMPADVPTSGGGIGDMLASIPPMYLMIGAAIVLLMVLKK